MYDVIRQKTARLEWPLPMIETVVLTFSVIVALVN